MKRLDVTERKGFAKCARDMDPNASRRGYRVVPLEPALGTLEQRLNIIIKRHGGRIGRAS